MNARIHDLIRQGPNERIIFAREGLSPRAVARLIASLANSAGGVILFGVRGRRIVGLRDGRAVLATIARAAQLVMPALLIEPALVQINGRALVALDVPRGLDAPYLTADGQILVRRGPRSVPADAREAAGLAQRSIHAATLLPLSATAAPHRLQAKSAPPPVDLDHIMLKLERLILANAELARKLDASNSWQSRLIDQLIGVGLGIIASVVLFYLFGIS